MPSWLEDVAGPNFAPAVLWTLLALVVLVIVLVIVRIVRSMTFGTFVAGGRNRKTRLAVMDAAAVDSQRRLVLVRRDDVEHLILIGGPTDVVVERDIRLHASTRRPGPQGRQRPRSRVREQQRRAAPSRACRAPRAAAADASRPPPARAPVAPVNAAPARMPSPRLPRSPISRRRGPRPATLAAVRPPRQNRGRRISTGQPAISISGRARQEEAGNDAGRRNEPSARRAFEQAVEHRTVRVYRRRLEPARRFHKVSSGGPM